MIAIIQSLKLLKIGKSRGVDPRNHVGVKIAIRVKDRSIRAGSYSDCRPINAARSVDWMLVN